MERLKILPFSFEEMWSVFRQELFVRAIKELRLICTENGLEFTEFPKGVEEYSLPLISHKIQVMLCHIAYLKSAITKLE